jgi:hypothetical protein
MTDRIEHKGYTIVVLRRSGGWRVYIRPPNRSMTRHEFPESLSADAVVAAAKRIIDEMAAAAEAARRGSA